MMSEKGTKPGTVSKNPILSRLQFCIARGCAQQGIPYIHPSPRPPDPKPFLDPPAYTSRKEGKRIAAELRLAEIEREWEAQQVREAEDDVRRRRMARCVAEIQRLEARPADTPELAYLVTMGIRDWQEELRLLEEEGRR